MARELAHLLTSGERPLLPSVDYHAITKKPLLLDNVRIQVEDSVKRRRRLEGFVKSRQQLNSQERRQLQRESLPVSDRLKVTAMMREAWNAAYAKELAMKRPASVSEFHVLGAELEVYVSRSSKGSQGTRGVAVRTTKRMIDLVAASGKLRQIPKNGTIFRLEVGEQSYLLDGEALQAQNMFVVTTSL